MEEPLVVDHLAVLKVRHGVHAVSAPDVHADEGRVRAQGSLQTLDESLGRSQNAGNRYQAFTVGFMFSE